MTSSIYQGWAVDQAGDIIPEATITVRDNDTNALVGLWSNRATTSGKTNPFNADTDGYFFFYRTAGRYKIEISDGVDTVTVVNVQLGTASEHDVGTDADDIPLVSDLADVALSGEYYDLLNRPDLGSAAFLDAGTSAGEVRTNSQNDGRFLRIANNLNDLENAGTARSNLGLGTASEHDVGTDPNDIPLNSDLADVARSGDYDDLENKPALGSAAFLTAGTSSGEVRINSQNDGRFLRIANNLNDLENAGTARSNLGLGTAATTDATAYATSAQGAKADTALQPNTAITVTTIDTGQGAVECYAMDQNVRTTDSTTFAQVTATSGITVATSQDLLAAWKNRTAYTPTVSGSGGSAGSFAATINGEYVRLGNFCFGVVRVLNITDLGSWSNAFRVSLPFAAVSTLSVGSHVSWMAMHAFAGQLQAIISNGTSYATIVKLTSGATATNLLFSDLVTSADNRIDITFAYFLA